MTRKEKNKFINREITFPIKFDNQILTASPGDSVASALYHSNYQLSKGSIISSNREVVFQKKSHPGRKSWKKRECEKNSGNWKNEKRILKIRKTR